MANNQQGNLFSNNLIQKFLENDQKLLPDENDKFIEIASSLAYYLKSLSNIKRLLDYVTLTLKHTFDQQSFLIIPLDENGQIWKENIKYSGDKKNLKIDVELNSYLNNFDFSRNHKLKEIDFFEKALKNKFKEYEIKSYKIL